MAAEDCLAKADCPSVPTSLKDGYAVVWSDLENASEDRPVKLKVCGTSVAGGSSEIAVTPGAAVKIMTGARIPDGADAVIAEEFTREKDGWVSCLRDLDPRRNIIERGYDVAVGEPVASRGEVLTPARTGLWPPAEFPPSESIPGHESASSPRVTSWSVPASRSGRDSSTPAILLRCFRGSSTSI